MPFNNPSRSLSSSSTPSRNTPMIDSLAGSAQNTAAASPMTTQASSATSSPKHDMDDEADVEVGKELANDKEFVADEKELETKVKYLQDMDEEERYRNLDSLLQKSSTYTSLLNTQMDLVKSRTKIYETASRGRGARGRGRGKGTARTAKKRRTIDSDDDGESSPEAKADDEDRFQQPELVTGGKLKDYQLDGVAWMVTLYENGISGILADEMGLGKTLQTIAFCAYLRRRANRPFLIVCPLSTLHNWIDEFEKFAPEIPVCMYHGTPDNRAELRRTTMRPIDPDDGGVDENTLDSSSDGEEHKQEDSEVEEPEDVGRGKRKRKTGLTKSAGNATATTRSSSRVASRKSVGRAGRIKKPISLLSSDEEDGTHKYDSANDNDDDDDMGYYQPKAKSNGKFKPPNKRKPAKRHQPIEYQSVESFPVVITTYEIIIKDRKYLSSKDYEWGYIVVDEGHRLKNLDCKLVREIKQYKSACRLILTGTPLHNNIGELWSLMNFILPDIFNDLYTFQQFFNVPELSSKISSERTQKMISQLHQILKPFILRRLKVDVEHNLPPKKEYILYAPVTENQKGVYDAVVKGVIREYLIKEKSGVSKVNRDADESASDEGRKLRNRKDSHRQLAYDIDNESDRSYFKRLERGEYNTLEEAIEKRRWGNNEDDAEENDIGVQFMRKRAVKQVNNLRLKNTVMQLRKVCSHPFLFDWPVDPQTGTQIVDEQLVRSSGKMLLLEQLLDELFRRGHFVLLFSQFTTMLDIIEDWAIEFKGWTVCRIDGSTGALDRREEMRRFQAAKDDDPDAPRLFLLSTRAGGLGINLTRADTVIFYDSDWNPQMDMQAQDRAHRIGQTRPVLIFRLVTAHTIENKILERATEKRKLEALVIAKGKFKMPHAQQNTNNSKESLAELAASLLLIEGEKIEVVSNADVGKRNIISEHNLEMLLDRSPGVFEERTKGWTSANTQGTLKEEKPKGAAFEVFDLTAGAINDPLAEMLDEEHYEEVE